MQDFIAAGQFRGGEQLIEVSRCAGRAPLSSFMEPLYPGGLDGVTPGSSCIANAYTSNHDIDRRQGNRRIARASRCMSSMRPDSCTRMLLRIQALLLPVQTLVLSGH